MTKKLEKASKDFVLILPKTIESLLGCYYTLVSKTNKNRQSESKTQLQSKNWTATGLQSKKS